MAKATQEKEARAYSPTNTNRFDYVVTENGRKYDIGHIFDPITDERYVQYLNDFKIVGDEDNINEEGREAAVRLWDDLINSVAGITFSEGVDWKAHFPVAEKTTAIADLLAVAIADDDAHDADSAPDTREIGPKTEQVVFTEAMFNGHILKQRHVLKQATFEDEKKYAWIAGKRFKATAVRGFRKKNRVEYIPQDEAFGELYDELLKSVTGFAGDTVPLRFKTAVIHHVFANRIEARDLGK